MHGESAGVGQLQTRRGCWEHGAGRVGMGVGVYRCVGVAGRCPGSVSQLCQAMVACAWLHGCGLQAEMSLAWCRG